MVGTREVVGVEVADDHRGGLGLVVVGPPSREAPDRGPEVVPESFRVGVADGVALGGGGVVEPAQNGDLGEGVAFDIAAAA